MALTIKMRIDEQPEHSYVFSTDGSEVVLIPLSVIQNGSYPAPEGYAYNLVSVNVPSTILDELNITANGTYTAEDGHAYDVVTVNVEPLLEEVTRSYSANGTYTIQPSEGYDGIEDAVITVAVPSPQTQTKSVNYNQNGNYSVAPDSGKLLDGVNVGVNVPNSYSASDEGKVVDNGALVAQSSQNITQNGTYDTTLKNEVVVNVSGSAPVLIEKNITANGTYNASSDNADGYSKVVANVPNTYSASDEGKVVDNGALVAQTSQNITANGTYDTTLNDEVVVNVSGGGGTSDVVDGTFTTPAEASTEFTVNTGYSGSKKLRGVFVTMLDGEYNVTGTGFITMGMLSRNNPNTTPVFDNVGVDGNRWSYAFRYKQSGSAVNTIGGQPSIPLGDSQTALTNTNTTPKIYFNNQTQFRGITTGGSGTTPGFKQSTTYRYIAFYQ